MFVSLLKAILDKARYSCKIKEVWHNKQKELRIADTLEPVMNGQRLVSNKAVLEKDITKHSDCEDETELNHSLLYQLTHLTRERGALKHEDTLDTLATAVAFHVERLDIDSDEACAQHKAELMDEILEQFIDNYENGGFASLN